MKGGDVTFVHGERKPDQKIWRVVFMELARKGVLRISVGTSDPIPTSHSRKKPPSMRASARSWKGFELRRRCVRIGQTVGG